MIFITHYNNFTSVLENTSAFDSDVVVRLYKFIKEFYKIYGDRKKNLTKQGLTTLLKKYKIYSNYHNAIRFEILQQISPNSYVVKSKKNEIDDFEQFTIQLYLKLFLQPSNRKKFATVNKIALLTSMLDKEAEKKAKYKKPINKDKAKESADKNKKKSDISNIIAIIQFLNDIINDTSVDKVRVSFRMFIQRNNLSIAKYLEFMLNTYVRINGDKYEVFPEYNSMPINKIAEKIYEEL